MSMSVPFAGGWEAHHHRHRHCIWIVTPPDYEHHSAFEEIAQAVSFAFVELGGSAPLVRHPSEWAGRAPIVFGANLCRFMPIPDLPPASIIMNLEQTVPGSHWLDPGYVSLLKRYPVLDYNASIAFTRKSAVSSERDDTLPEVLCERRHSKYPAHEPTSLYQLHSIES